MAEFIWTCEPWFRVFGGAELINCFIQERLIDPQSSHKVMCGSHQRHNLLHMLNQAKLEGVQDGLALVQHVKSVP